jgi:hypothetical protein
MAATQSPGPREPDCLSLTDEAMHLQLELLAYEEAITRSERVIPRSLAEFLDPPAH